jgi:deazaflavin-dependent oxidoreductase (nitroreductase family)
MSNWNTSEWNMNNWNKQVIEEFRATGGKVGRVPNPLLLLTTTGRKSGKPFTVPVGYLTDADRFIVVASSATADWYLNLLAHPQVKVEVGNEAFTATATIVEGEQRESFLHQARQMVEAQQSQGYGMGNPPPSNDVPVVALQPVR